MKTLLVIGILLLLVFGFYFVWQNKEPDLQTREPITEQGDDTETYRSSELGFEFDYKTGDDGYVLDERIPVDFGEHRRTLILMRADDKADIDEGNIPEGGEGPPVITITVLQNLENQQSGIWARENSVYSNYNLILSDEPEEVVVGKANAVRYSADGLYPSDVVVVAHGENVYVFVGQYLEPNSDLKRDFSILMESVQFIPEP